MLSKRRICITLAVFMVWLIVSAVPSLAYFNRGAVDISLSRTSVSVEAGSSAAVTVNIDPIKEDQLPGCGMAECPQSCGNTGCLNENGECTCGGTEYKTYYSSVSVSSSDTSVVSAGYAGGTLTIKGISAGTAVVTVTGSMRQYTDSSVTLSVKVTGPENETSSGGSVPAVTGSGRGDTPETGLTVSPVDAGASGEVQTESGTDGSDSTPGDDVTDNEDEEGEDDGTGRLLNTKKGLCRIVELTDSTDTAACFLKSAEEKSRLTLQKKSGGSVKWSWTFDAGNIDTEAAAVFRPGIEISGELPDDADSSFREGAACFIQFENEGRLPGAAEIYVNVSEYFPENTEIKLYVRDGDGGNFKESNEIPVLENGYVTFTAQDSSDCILTDASSAGSGGGMGFAGMAAAAAAVCAAAGAAAGFVFYRKRVKKQV